MIRKSLITGAGAVALALLTAAASAAKTPPPNMDFEAGEPGAPPAEWRAAGAAAAWLDPDKPYQGRLAARLTRPASSTGTPQDFGNLMRSVDASPYRGKRIRFRAAVRAEVGPAASAALWLRVDREGRTMGFFDNMDDRPIRSGAWQTYDIVGDVAPDAERLAFGMMLKGGGEAWIDAASLTVVGDAGERIGVEAARPLTAQGRANLTAFARLFGYVRYFHPSDQAAEADWNQIALAGVQRVEAARSPRELADVLKALFGPIAPTLQIVPTAQAGRAPPAPGGKDGHWIAWSHAGLSNGQPGPYASERVEVAGPESVRLDLGSGLTAVMPLHVWRGANGRTLPLGAPRAPAPDKPDGFVPTGDDRATRLADVVVAWNALQHFYPYFDVVKADWPAELGTSLDAAATDKDAAAFGATLKRLIAALKDGHGNAFHAEGAPNAALPVHFAWIEERLVVTAVAAEGAEGLQPGDVVLAIDGRPVAERVAEDEALVSSATAQWARDKVVRALRTGRKGEATTLRVRDESGAARDVRLAYSGPLGDVPGRLLEPRPGPVAELKPGLMYVDLDRVPDAELRAAIPRLAAAKAVVFDMRGYPDGGTRALLPHLSDRPLQSANWNVPIVTHPDGQGWTWRTTRWDLPPAQPRIAGKLVFVTGGEAISYAESVMGIVEAYRLGDIVGETTAGTNGNITGLALPGGYRLIWTGMKVTRHDGGVHHGVGIAPTVPATRTIAGVRAGRDEVLDAAVKAAGF